VHELRAPSTRAEGEVVGFDEHDVEAAARCIERNACARDAAPDDEQIDRSIARGKRIEFALATLGIQQ